MLINRPAIGRNGMRCSETKGFGEAFRARRRSPRQDKSWNQHFLCAGLIHGSYRGVRQISHDGTTAGYQANSAAPSGDKNVSIAVFAMAKVT